MHIVLAEDGEDHARILGTILRRNGLDCLRFTNGLDTYEYLKQNKMPDLLITDVMMPGMSGFELLARLKADGILPPCIVITSRQREDDILEGLNYGALDYIAKPFSPAVVIAKIKNALKRPA